jgi:ribosomal protein L37E
MGNFEGTKDQSSIFLNYHPGHVKKLFKEAKIKIYKRYGCSYLRVPFLKNKFKTSTLVKIELFFQNIFSWTNISPSIFFIGRSQKEVSHEKRYRSLNEILICPRCKGVLSFSQNTAKCSKCGNIYSKTNDIWDFRID